MQLLERAHALISPTSLPTPPLLTWQVVLPTLPTLDAGVASAVAPPAAIAGGVVLAGVALQAGVRKLTSTLSRTVRIAAFGALVGAAAAKILGLL